MFTKAERLISLRNLRPKKKEGFLKIISIFSFLGIMLGVAILIIVMSVMNGFKTDLTKKIIGLNPHIIIQPNSFKINDEYVLNPAIDDMDDSDLDMVVAGSEKAVLMVESDANELSEDLMIGGILFAHQEMQSVIKGIKDFSNEVLPERTKYENILFGEETKSSMFDSGSNYLNYHQWQINIYFL